MHICCANCALYPLSVLRERGLEVTGLWFNPNIHPYTEYRSRIEAVQTLETLRSLDMEYVDWYGLRDFVRTVAWKEGERCLHCYSVRLERTARRAAELGADAFTTSLLVSPYQKFDLITGIGRQMQNRHGVEFLAEDFRHGYGKGRRMSRELGLYRQKYCGCIYSEMERFAPKETVEDAATPHVH